MTKVTILYSGGLDSLAMYYLCKGYIPIGAEPVVVHPIFFDIGQPYLEKEIRSLPPETDIRRVDWLGKTKDGIKTMGLAGDIYIPGRNMALAALAACMTLPDELWIGALAGETHAKAVDKNNTFRHMMTTVLSYTTMKPNLEVMFPLAARGWNKVSIVEYLLQRGVSVEEIHNTNSCLSNTPTPCGHCISCFRRWGVFGQLGIPEAYEVDPLSVEANLAILSEMKHGTHYDGNRKAEIVPYVIVKHRKLWADL